MGEAARVPRSRHPLFGPRRPAQVGTHVMHRLRARTSVHASHTFRKKSYGLQIPKRALRAITNKAKSTCRRAAQFGGHKI